MILILQFNLLVLTRSCGTECDDSAYLMFYLLSSLSYIYLYMFSISMLNVQYLLLCGDYWRLECGALWRVLASGMWRSAPPQIILYWKRRHFVHLDIRQIWKKCARRHIPADGNHLSDRRENIKPTWIILYNLYIIIIILKYNYNYINYNTWDPHLQIWKKLALNIARIGVCRVPIPYSGRLRFNSGQRNRIITILLRHSGEIRWHLNDRLLPNSFRCFKH
jgi:hypothetical protein